MLVPAINRIAARFGRVPRVVTADRGYGEAKVDAELEANGVRRVVIPRKGRPSAERRRVEHARGFRRLVKWRTGCEGRVAHVKRNYGWSRTLMDGEAGAATWCGWGVLAHNSTKIAYLTAVRNERRATAIPARAQKSVEREVS
jgi:IS5 family transposase